MKKFILAITATSAMIIALTAFTILPNKTVDSKSKNDKKEQINKKETNPCPCSNYICNDCGTVLEFSFTAWKEDLGECRYCKGTGTYYNSKCGYCDGTGRKWKWQSGCICKKCNIAYIQPKNC